MSYFCFVYMKMSLKKKKVSSSRMNGTSILIICKYAGYILCVPKWSYQNKQYGVKILITSFWDTQYNIDNYKVE